MSDNSETVSYFAAASNSKSLLFIPLSTTNFAANSNNAVPFVVAQNSALLNANQNESTILASTFSKKVMAKQKMHRIKSCTISNSNYNSTITNMGKKQLRKGNSLPSSQTSSSQRWRPILPKIQPKLAPMPKSTAKNEKHKVMEQHGDCGYCILNPVSSMMMRGILPSLPPPSSLPFSTVVGENDAVLPHPLPIRPTPFNDVCEPASSFLYDNVSRHLLAYDSTTTLRTPSADIFGRSLLFENLICVNNSTPQLGTTPKFDKFDFEQLPCTSESRISAFKATAKSATETSSNLLDVAEKITHYDNNNNSDNNNNNSKNNDENATNYSGKWCGDDVRSQTEDFRSFLKHTACEFKRSVDYGFECKSEAEKAKKNNEVEKKANMNLAKKKYEKVTKRIPEPTVNFSNAVVAGLTSGASFNSAPSFNSAVANFCGSDRFSPSSVSCASIDSGFSESNFPPSPPESSNTTQSSNSAISFASFQPISATTAQQQHSHIAVTNYSAEIKQQPLKRKQLDSNNNEQINNNKTNKQIKNSEDMFDEKNSNNEKHKIALQKLLENATDEADEKPLAKVPKISEIFFNSEVSYFVNNLLKRSRTDSNSEGNTNAESGATIIEESFVGAKIKIEVASVSEDVELFVPERRKTVMDTVMLREKETVIATFPTKKQNERKSLRTRTVMLEKTIEDDFDKLNLTLVSASTSSDQLTIQSDAEVDSSNEKNETLLKCSCLWQDCESRFETDNHLYDHVLERHLEKLRPLKPQLKPMEARHSPRQKTTNRKASEAFLICEWDSCAMCLKRGDKHKQFEWLLEHYTTRHAPRAQPFACLFENCKLRFRSRRSLNDHLRSAHDNEKPNGKRNSSLNNSSNDASNYCFNYQPRVQLPSQADIIDSRTMDWIRNQLRLSQLDEQPCLVECRSAAAAAAGFNAQSDRRMLFESRASVRKAMIPLRKFLHESDTVDKFENDAKLQDFFSYAVVRPLSRSEPTNTTVRQHKMTKSDATNLIAELCKGRQNLAVA